MINIKVLDLLSIITFCTVLNVQIFKEFCLFSWSRMKETFKWILCLSIGRTICHQINFLILLSYIITTIKVNVALEDFNKNYMNRESISTGLTVNNFVQLVNEPLHLRETIIVYIQCNFLRNWKLWYVFNELFIRIIIFNYNHG